MEKVTFSSVALWVIILLLPLWYIRFHLKRRRLYELAAKFDGPPTVPILGNALKCLIPYEKVKGVVEDGITHYKSPTRLWFGPMLALHVWKPEQLEIIFNSPCSIKKQRLIYNMTEFILGRSLLSLPVEDWKRHRRMIGPAFAKKNLAGFIDIFNRHSKALVKELKCEEGKGMFNVHDYLTKRSLEIVLETILDFDGNQDNPKSAHLIRWLEIMQQSIVARITNILYLSDFVFNLSPVGRKLSKVKKEYNAYMNKVIEKWKEDVLKRHLDDNVVADGSTKPVKFVEHLLAVTDESGNFTTEELRDAVKTIIVTGFETTASSVGYLLLILGMYPEIQEKVYQEMKEVLGDRDVEFEDLKHLPYLDRVIKETLRLFPIGVGFARHCEQEMQLEEYTIPADTTILIGIFGVHRDPKIWHNPTKFDPDRFLPEEEAKRHPYSWIPFLAGSRDCIGKRFGFMVIQVMMAELIRNYKVSTIYKDVEDIDVTWILIFKPIRGYVVGLQARGQN